MKTHRLRRRYGHALSASLSKAVHAMRIYLGSVDYAGLRDQNRLYQRVAKAVTREAQAHGITVMSAWGQIEQEAYRQGVIRPRPGQDI